MAGTLRRHVALVAIVGLALGLGASASANIDASHTARTVATAADCDGNGTPDTLEAQWNNRDDDGDGFCNGVDACPYEATATNDDSACQMQAITVPFTPSDPSKPHPITSGALTTLKGIARYGGNEFSWDYGDGSPAMPWTPISDRFNLGVRHAYAGNSGDEFTATLSVRNSANPDAVATATYPVQIEDATDLTDPAQVDVRAEMAADESLWWLHTQMSRGQFSDGAPGENQDYGLWNAGMYTTCAALDALETHGSTPGSNWSSDPYVEDTQRALAYVFYNSNGIQISNQPYGNPDMNGNGLGVTLGVANDTYTNGVCAIALADSASPGRVAATGRAGIYGRTYADLGQDVVDWFAYGQEDICCEIRGGWGYYANSGGATGETNRWPVLAMDDAARELNAQIPAFVRQNIPFFLNYSHYTSRDTDYGGWGWEAANTYTSDGFTGAGIAIHLFLGDSIHHPDVQGALGFLYRHWNDAPVDGHFGNLGDSDAMYTIARALHEGGLSQITEYDYSSGAPTGNSFDWFHATPADGREGYGVYLVTNQRPDGSFVDAFSGAGTHGNGPQWSTAWDTMVLAMAPAATATAQPPTASAGGPYTVGPGGSVTLDATGSTDPNGLALTYAWDLTGNGLYSDSTSAAPTFNAPATAPAGTVYPVCVRVTSAGGSASACSTVTVTVVATPPTVVIVPVGAVNGPLPRDVALDGSHSSGTAGDTLTYAWTVDDPDGTTTDATSAVATHTFRHYGTYGVHLLVSDGLLTSEADTSVEVVDKTLPTLTVPGDLVLADGPTVTQQVNDWLASATATDDDPDHPTATVTNDFTGVTPGTTQTITWTATDAAGNQATASASLTVQVDTSPPQVEAHVDGTLGDDDWYRSDVHVTWQVTEPDSAVTTTGCDPTDVTADTDAAGVTLTCTATSAGGKTTDTITVKRDATPPTVTYTGNAGSYTIGQTVTIHCAAVDLASGIDSTRTTCVDIDAPAASFGLGPTSETATATDLAGNVGTGSVSFTVAGVTCGGLRSLITAWVKNKGIANALLAKLDGVCGARNANAKKGSLTAFDDQLAAQAGKALTVEHAELLEQYAATL